MSEEEGGREGKRDGGSGQGGRGRGTDGPEKGR